MSNPVIFLARAILVAVVATFAVVSVHVLVYLFDLGSWLGEGTIGFIFAVGLACAGVRYGHQQAKQCSSPLLVQIRLFLLLFALFLFLLSTLRYASLSFHLVGRDFAAGGVITPVLLLLWLLYWCWKNVLSLGDSAARTAGSDRQELALMCAGLLLVPYLLLIPGFSLAQV
ncbi:MAG: hypothetical protein FWF11_03735, partial [Coriobacteriia bacterium]|nr:hypothetical protein [Coriobacteriia bacterium]